MFSNLCINKFSFYRPPKENPSETPKLAYIDSLFKRRLSQLSRMTIEVIHQVKDSAPEAKIVFTSFRGEIGRQLKINRGLVDDFAILPAQFSLSVFNTPPAVATIALQIKNGYTALYPSEHRLYDAFMAAVAPVLAGIEKQVIFAYGDELIPEDYESIKTDDEQKLFPLAFALVISAEKTAGACVVPEGIEKFSPEDFLFYVQKNGKAHD